MKTAIMAAMKVIGAQAASYGGVACAGGRGSGSIIAKNIAGAAWRARQRLAAARQQTINISGRRRRRNLESG
jgi:hypothetical protein